IEPPCWAGLFGITGLPQQHESSGRHSLARVDPIEVGPGPQLRPAVARASNPQAVETGRQIGHIHETPDLMPSQVEDANPRKPWPGGVEADGALACHRVWRNRRS